ncbi:hypothetical protein [Saccharopolyspora phatthalungensis]|uniref:hypothetical protein n=1 Tax=Saccharopolyspora phatthalungensis TaxID=664693 RepID=UPI00161C9730
MTWSACSRNTRRDGTRTPADRRVPTARTSAHCTAQRPLHERCEIADINRDARFGKILGQ